MSDKKYVVKFEYEIDYDNLADFLKAIQPYAKDLNITRFFEYYHRKGRGRVTKNHKTKEEVYFKEVCNALSPDNRLSTAGIVKRLVQRVGFCYSYKSFTRLLMKMVVKGILEVKKVPKERGGYENIWWLK